MSSSPEPRAVIQGDERGNACLFCFACRDESILAENGTTFALADRFEVTPGHFLVIPKRHVLDLFAMSNQERQDSFEIVDRLRNGMVASDPTIVGFNIGMNCGTVAGQTVMHAHTHVIPRRLGDVVNPRGGVRGVIPDRRSYDALIADRDPSGAWEESRTSPPSA
jgi:diadenosine tetraphosphate (Ap4A) HIT family hydrolase